MKSRYLFWARQGGFSRPNQLRPPEGGWLRPKPAIVLEATPNALRLIVPQKAAWVSVVERLPLFGSLLGFLRVESLLASLLDYFGVSRAFALLVFFPLPMTIELSNSLLLPVVVRQPQAVMDARLELVERHGLRRWRQVQVRTDGGTFSLTLRGSRRRVKAALELAGQLPEATPGLAVPPPTAPGVPEYCEACGQPTTWASLAGRWYCGGCRRFNGGDYVNPGS